MRIDEYGALEKSTNAANLIVEYFIIAMDTTGGDESWLNGKIKYTL